MKILFLFTHNKGLLSKFFMELAHKLTKDDHEVKVYSLKKYPGKIWVNNIEVIAEANGGYLNNYYQIFKCIKEISPDVIISNFNYANPALLAGKILKIKKNIVWVHSLKKHGDPWKYQIILKSWFYKFADTVVVNSHILEKELKEVFKVEKSKIHAIPFWSNIGKIASTPIEVEKGVDKILLGCPGRFTNIKNQIVIINAIQALKDKVNDKIEVYFAGEGPTCKDIERKVKELNLQEHVNFLGVLSAGQMKDFYKKMDVIVLPSLYESFGLVFIETISLGTPVIVSTEFGALDFVEKDSEEIKKILFNPRDPRDLAWKLQNLLENGDMDEEFYKKIYSDHFDKEVIYNRLLKILEF